MAIDLLQEQCELGQQHLMQMNYLEAEKVLATAERQAWKSREFDTLSRLYMPLQEARRQIRQRCGEGVVCLDLLATGPEDRIEGRHIVENYPSGQLLVAGWASIEPAAMVRWLQQQFQLYVETFLGAVYETTAGRMVAILPLEGVAPPKDHGLAPDQLRNLLPPHSLLLPESEIPRGIRPGNADTYAQVMSLWESLHRPFLAAADAETDPIKKIEALRRTIQVDYACELAHQRIADLARDLARSA